MLFYQYCLGIYATLFSFISIVWVHCRVFTSRSCKKYYFTIITVCFGIVGFSRLDPRSNSQIIECCSIVVFSHADPIVITTSPNDINVILKCPFTECNVTWSRSPSVRSVAMETTCNQLIISKVTYEHFGKYTCHRRRWLGNCITFRTYTFNLMQAPRTTTAAFIIRSAASAASTKPTSLQSTSSKLMAASSINTLLNSVDNEPTSVHSGKVICLI